MKPDLSCTIAKAPLQNCLYNASGARCRTEVELQQLCDSEAAAVICKSATPAYRAGNPEPRYQENDLGSINSMGLPNLGLDKYREMAAQIKPKPYFISIAGLSLEDNIAMLSTLKKSPPDYTAVELNLSCPNVPGKPQTGYDFERTREVLDKVFSHYDRPLGVKLPPYFDMIHFEMMANILNDFPLSFVTCVNSIGNALFIDPETESVVIKPKHGFGGIGGDYIKPTALANVRQFYLRLKGIDVVACGGVKSGVDAFEHILCGATAIQVGTQLMKEGTKCFERISKELSNLMDNKGYKFLSDFRGKLKSLDC